MHTSEPWKALPPNKSCSCWIIVQESPIDNTAPVYIGSVYTEGPHAPYAEGNAKCFAKAPEMLALCRDLYAEVGVGGDLDWHLREEGYANRLREILVALGDSPHSLTLDG